MDATTIAIVGAGQLGSRHLQALSGISKELKIIVVDPSKKSLSIAKSRWETLGDRKHSVQYHTAIPNGIQVDVAIVATSSDQRANAIQDLLLGNGVKGLVLEKLLFSQRGSYEEIDELLTAQSVPAWVNCSMRTMPFYAKLKERMGSGPISYRVVGSNFGLVTNAIHYLDHVAYLIGQNSFTMSTDALQTTVISSKRKGYFEINGTLTATFTDGSTCVVTSLDEGSVPLKVEVVSPHFQCISRETENKAWTSAEESGWIWTEEPAEILYQSQMTTRVVEDILTTGSCDLVEFSESKRTHLTLLDPLKRHLLNNGISGDGRDYPFT